MSNNISLLMNNCNNDWRFGFINVKNEMVSILSHEKICHSPGKCFLNDFVIGNGIEFFFETTSIFIKDSSTPMTKCIFSNLF